MTTSLTANAETDVASMSSKSPLRHILLRDQSGFTTSQSSPTVDPDMSINRHQSLVLIAGNNVSLPCSSPSRETVLWLYCILCCSERSLIYSGGNVNRRSHLSPRSSVSDCSGRKCAFHVVNMQLDDAGSFTCVWQNVYKQWSLTVLGE